MRVNARGFNGNSTMELASIYGHEKAYGKKARTRTSSHTSREVSQSIYGAARSSTRFCVNICLRKLHLRGSVGQTDCTYIRSEARFLRSNVLDICMWRNQAEIYNLQSYILR
ncbi:uncharacterized protein BDCG_17603 [Blastomyces dermatitidis ER-3]|uniref:Uncharacterized protein n=2 Tax=Ajellomyces dermatitidis TaxID=5039 RepID=A0A0J9EQ55_AJEDA|nr:uncharacterized protein BDCG_17603 [Blastomyces dermatitidis ER-3]KMW68136.1 hypothetical protein BDDG_12605 [Blastomyces dermatitidis ATCC 18188]OAT02508.1 hypothetical protein BDCG_17603 [Blastomyces dermatitidis ER-3]